MAELDKDGETTVGDVAWLCSLSEYEIDLMISLKLLITQRAKRIGCAELAKKFDLKMIRAIALVLMEHLKEELKSLSLTPEKVAFLDACNLLKCDNKVDATVEELSKNIGVDILTFLSSSQSNSKRKKEVGSRE